MTCTGQLVGTYNTNIVVPANASCQVVGGTIIGNVSVGEGATLRLEVWSAVYGNVSVTTGATLWSGNSRIYGNLTTAGAQSVAVLNGYVAGNTRIDGTTGAVQMCYGGILAGDLLTQSACGIFTTYGSSGKFGNVTLSNNVDTVVFGGNYVVKNLDCFGNLKEVTNAGVANIVKGQKLGQCANL